MLCRLNVVKTPGGRLAMFTEPGKSVPAARMLSWNGWEMYHAWLSRAGVEFVKQTQAKHAVSALLQEAFASRRSILSTWHPIEAQARQLTFEILPFEVAFQLEHDEAGNLVEIFHAGGHESIEEDLHQELTAVIKHYSHMYKIHGLGLAAGVLLIPAASGHIGLYLLLGAWIGWHQHRFLASYLSFCGADNFVALALSSRIRFVVCPKLSAGAEKLRSGDLSLDALGLSDPLWQQELRRWERLPRPWHDDK